MNRCTRLVLSAMVTGIGVAIFVLVASARQAQVTGWQTPVQISDTIGASYGPHLVVDQEGTVQLIWYDWIDLVSHPPYLQYAERTYSGDWTTPAYLPDRPYGGFPAVVSDAEGKLHIAWEYYRFIDGFNDAVTYINRDVDGTWTAVEKVPSQEIRPSASQPDIGVSPDGRVHVVYKDWLGPGHQKTIHHTVKLPNGSWEQTQQVTPDEGDYTLPMLAVDDLGITHLIYTKNYTDHYDFYYTHVVTGGTWISPTNMGISPTPWNSIEQFTSDRYGYLHLVWSEWDQSVFPWECSVKYISKLRTEPWMDSETLADDCASSVAIATDNQGQAHVVWNYDNKLWYIQQDAEGNFSTPVVADSTDPFHGQDETLTIAIDSLGGRHVAWDFGNGNIWATYLQGEIINYYIALPMVVRDP